MSRMLNSASFEVETVTITAAGTAQSPTTFPVPDGVRVSVMGHPDNTGYIKVGQTAAKAQAAMGANNVPLAGSVSASFQLTNTNLLFLDATVSGEKAIVFFET